MWGNKMSIKILLKRCRKFYIKKIEEGLTEEEEKTYNDLLRLLRNEIKNLKLELFYKIIEERKEEEFKNIIKENEKKLILILLDLYAFNKNLINKIFDCYEKLVNELNQKNDLNNTKKNKIE